MALWQTQERKYHLPELDLAAGSNVNGSLYCTAAAFGGSRVLIQPSTRSELPSSPAIWRSTPRFLGERILSREDAEPSGILPGEDTQGRLEVLS
jgi:hypothetical protein